MTDREKIIRDFENCAIENGCVNCNHNNCIVFWRNVLALLKEQEPRVMTLEEIRERAETVDPDPVFVERKSGSTTWDLYTIDIIYHMAKRSYMDIRVWTSRPSEQQMRETPWEGDADA